MLTPAAYYFNEKQKIKVKKQLCIKTTGKKIILKRYYICNSTLNVINYLCQSLTNPPMIFYCGRQTCFNYIIGGFFYLKIFNSTAPSGGCFSLKATTKKQGENLAFFDFNFYYFANSVARHSLMTFTFICPGYSISCSIFCAISFARNSVCASFTCSGFTITRTSLPACIA